MAEKVRCVIICGSPEADIDFIKEYINPESDYIMCADAGYLTARRAEIIPDIFVGDFDSYSGDVDESAEVVKLNTHKDDTDSMHCASVAVERGFKRVVLLAATGGRLDHTVANLSVLKYLEENGVEAFVVNKNESVRLLVEGDYAYNNLNGKTFSVLPFACESVRVTFEGEVEYPGEDLELLSSQVLGVSNVFRSDRVKIRILKGIAVLIVNSSQ